MSVANNIKHMRSLTFAALLLMTAFFVFARPAQATHDGSCSASYSGVSCFGAGEFVCKSSLSCFVPGAITCDAPGHVDCNTCTCQCSGSCNTPSTVGSCYTDMNSGAIVGVFSGGSCNAFACPGSHSYCASGTGLAKCRDNAQNDCVFGTVWDPCTDTCTSTPYVERRTNSTGPAQANAHINITGDVKFEGMQQAGSSALNLNAANQNLMYGNVAASSSAGSILKLQKGGSDRLVVDLDGNTATAGVLDVQGGSIGNSTGDIGILPAFNSNIILTTLGTGTITLNPGNGQVTLAAGDSLTVPGNLTVSGSFNLAGGQTYGGGTETGPSITFTGDTDTGLYHPAPDTVVITTGGNDGLIVDPTGYVYAPGNLGTGQYLIVNSYPGFGTGSASFWYDGAGGTDSGAPSTLHMPTGNMQIDTGNLTVGGVISGTFSGDGSDLSNLNASDITTGTMSWARLGSFPGACPAGEYVTAVGATLTCSTPAGGGGSGWTDNGSTITTTTALDKVGIGSPPTAKLHVFAAGGEEGLRVKSSNSKPFIVENDTDSNELFSVDAAGFTTLNGAIRIVDGNQAAGKVLTSDGTGIGSWQIPSGGGGTIDGTGTANRLARWSDADTLASGVVQDDGSNVGIGTAPSSSYRLRVDSAAGGDGIYAYSNQSGSDAIEVLNDYNSVFATGVYAKSTYGTALFGQGVTGVRGVASNPSGTMYGVWGEVPNAALGYGVYGVSYDTLTVGTAAGYFQHGVAGGDPWAKIAGNVGGARYAGYFSGNVNVTGNITGTHLGSGASLTSLNADNITSGTLSNSRLSISCAGQAISVVSGSVTCISVGGTNYFTLNSTTLYPNSSSYNLMLGTTGATTSYKLDVQGNARITTNLGVNGVLPDTQFGINSFGGSVAAVRGSGSTNGVQGESSAGNGVIGTSTSGYGVRGSGGAWGGYFTGTNGIYASGATAGQFAGNVTVSGNISVGSCTGCGGLSGGSTNYLPKWTSGTTIGNSQIQDNGTQIGIGAAPLSGHRIQVASPGTSGSLNSGIRGVGVGNEIGLLGFTGWGTGVRGETQSGGTGVYGYSSSGRGGQFQTTSGDYALYAQGQTYSSSTISTGGNMIASGQVQGSSILGTTITATGDLVANNNSWGAWTADVWCGKDAGWCSCPSASYVSEFYYSEAQVWIGCYEL
jgi:hypothetical protein